MSSTRTARLAKVVALVAIVVGSCGCSSDPAPIDDAPEPHASDVPVDEGTEISVD